MKKHYVLEAQTAPSTTTEGFYLAEVAIKAATVEETGFGYGRTRARAIAFALRRLADEILATHPQFPEDSLESL